MALLFSPHYFVLERLSNRERRNLLHVYFALMRLLFLGGSGEITEAAAAAAESFQGDDKKEEREEEGEKKKRSLEEFVFLFRVVKSDYTRSVHFLMMECLPRFAFFLYIYTFMVVLGDIMDEVTVCKVHLTEHFTILEPKKSLDRCF